jgi:hypothetical protein
MRHRGWLLLLGNAPGKLQGSQWSSPWQRPAPSGSAYRRRHLKDVDGTLERLYTLVSLQAKRQLECLVVRYGVTQKEMLERVLVDAERAALDALPASAHGAYYDKRPITLPRSEPASSSTPPREGKSAHQNMMPAADQCSEQRDNSMVRPTEPGWGLPD